MAKKYNDPNLFGIIGMGRFGCALALELIKAGKEVIAIDNNSAKLEGVKKDIIHVYLIDQITKDSLADAGIALCGTVIVGIGKDIESNLLATLNALELGVPRVISKAISADHGRVLEKLGAEVVLPEEDMGKRIAKSLTSTMTLDWLPVCNDFSIIELGIPQSLDNKTVIDMDLRKKFGINIIAIIHEGKADGTILPSTVLHSGDQLVVAGANTNLQQFQEANEK
ncbi:MAG: TrkA family potassium uptake protein [Sphaerochaetaceae bacterium]